MAIKVSAINNMTSAKDSAILSFASDYLQQEGVVKKSANHMLVTEQSPNAMAVDIEKGYIYVQNDAWVEGSNQPKYYRVEIDTKTGKSLTPNASANDWIVAICIKVDVGTSTPGASGELAGTVEAVYGAPAASPVAPAIPNHHTVIAYVQYNSTHAVITNARITDMRTQAFIDVTKLEGDLETNFPEAFVGNKFRQALTNGSFDIWQEFPSGTITTPNDDTYGPDMWNLLLEANGAWSFTRDTDVPSNGGSIYSLKATNVTANNQCAIVQFLENMDAKKFAGKNASLSFYAKTNSTEIANLRVAILSWNSTADSITSDVISAWAQNGTNPTWAANWTMENTPANLALTSSWQRFEVENIAIDTSGMTNLAVVVWVDDGTIATNDDFYITQIQLNEGSVALPYAPNDFEDELSRCESFWQKSFNYATSPADGAGISGSTALITDVNNVTYPGVTVFLKRRMRTTPTITFFNPQTSTANKFTNNSGTHYPAQPAIAVGEKSFLAVVNNTAVAQYVTLYIHWTANARL